MSLQMQVSAQLDDAERIPLIGQDGLIAFIYPLVNRELVLRGTGLGVNPHTKEYSLILPVGAGLSFTCLHVFPENQIGKVHKVAYTVGINHYQATTMLFQLADGTIMPVYNHNLVPIESCFIGGAEVTTPELRVHAELFHNTQVSLGVRMGKSLHRMSHTRAMATIRVFVRS